MSLMIFLLVGTFTEASKQCQEICHVLDARKDNIVYEAAASGAATEQHKPDVCKSWRANECVEYRNQQIASSQH